MLSGRYRLVGKLGEGAFGCTYLAFDRKLSKYWAIKEWKEWGDERAERQFWEELRILKDLDSACFPRIVEAFREEGRCFLVMDWIKGRSLEEVLRENGPLTWRETVKNMLELCQALALLHEQEPPLLHLDLKPANIMMTEEGIRLIDFGSAMREGEAGMLTGTPGYASPEQLRAENVDVRSDIYSLGAVCLAMLTGGEKKQREERREKRQIPRGKRPEGRRGGERRVPRRLKWVMEKALREEREERFGSVREMERALLLLVKKRLRHPFLAGVILSLALLAGIAGGIGRDGEKYENYSISGPEEGREPLEGGGGPERQESVGRKGRPARRRAAAILRRRKGQRKKPRRRALRLESAGMENSYCSLVNQYRSLVNQ